jgi:LPS export ABC transporter protein LptC
MIEFFMKKSLLFVLSLIIFSLFFFMVKGEKTDKNALIRKGESFIEGLKIIHKKNGAKDWILTARRADLTENSEKAHLSDIEMTIENKGFTVYADKGIYNMSGKNLTVEGRIVARSNNYLITSENIEFDSLSGNLKTDGNVKIEGKKFSLQGKGMNMDNAGQKVRINRDVKAVFNN